MLQDIYGEGLYSLCYRVSMARIIFSMLQGFYGEYYILNFACVSMARNYILYVTGSLLQGLYSLCYRVSIARIVLSMLQGLYGEDYILYVTGFLWQGIIFSMLQGLYGEDYILYVTGFLL